MKTTRQAGFNGAHRGRLKSGFLSGLRLWQSIITAAVGMLLYTTTARAATSNTVAEAATVPGLFNPISPPTAKAIGAKAVRVFIRGGQLDAILADKRNGKPTKLDDYPLYTNDGILVVATPVFWTPKDTSLPAENSPAWMALVEHFGQFVRTEGEHLRYLTLDNEPTVERTVADFTPREDGTIPAVRFYAALAARAKAEIKSNKALSRLKIASPGFFNIHSEADGTIGRQQHERLMLLLNWAKNDPHIDAIDLHLHVASVATMEKALAYMRRATKKPILVTEWSQALAAKSWLGEALNKAFASKWHRKEATGRDYVAACYVSPVSAEEWNAFVSGAPYDPDFMKRAFAVAVKYGVRVLCYGAHQQFGSADFDTKQLFANRTVMPNPDGSAHENYRFAAWYRELIALYDQGAFSKTPAR